MSDEIVASPWRRRLIGPLIVAVLIGLVLLSDSLRRLLVEALDQVTPLSVAATLPGQIAAVLLCSLALHALRPGVGYGGCLGSRLLRDAVGNLLALFPGLSAMVGARALVLAGGRTHAALSASALDKVAEIVAQVPYILLAGFVLVDGWDGSLPALGNAPAVAAVAGVALLGLSLVILRTAPGRHWIARLRAEWLLLKVELDQQKRGMPLSVSLHFVAWVMGGVQIWMAALALGFELDLFEAVAIESVAYAGRALTFFIPVGLGTQEASLVAAGLVFGLAPAESLALGFVLRLRDVVFGLPLLAWPLYEWRHLRRIKNPA